VGEAAKFGGAWRARADERAELARLRKEVKDLRQDREILRKAFADFAKETIR
jgi:transposase